MAVVSKFKDKQLQMNAYSDGALSNAVSDQEPRLRFVNCGLIINESIGHYYYELLLYVLFELKLNITTL